MHSNEKISSLYIHIPFCNSKCSYCDFFSLAGSDPELQSSVINAIIEQITAFSDRYSFSDIETVYIGGGTPTSLTLPLLEKILYSVERIIPSKLKEFSIEVNPETVNSNLVSLIKESPLTRVSIGIQSFSDRFLKILGRNCNSKYNRSAAALLSETGKDISFDLISSIPGQNISDGFSDIQEALNFKPSHISLYTLTIEDNTPFSKYYSENDIDDEIWIKSAELLEKSGYNNYEISNFSLKNKECLHNLNYWKMKSYLGAGPAAVSTVIENNRPVRMHNTDNIPLFLEGEKSNWNIKKEYIGLDDYFIEILMMGLRTSCGINIDEIDEKFGYNVYSIIGETIKKWEGKGYLSIFNNNMHLTKKGRLFHSSFIIDVMNELENGKYALP